MENNWIPVTERLPEHIEKALICNAKGDIVVGIFNPGTGNWLAPYEEGLFISGKATGNNRIVAWQPLPEPYEGEPWQ